MSHFLSIPEDVAQQSIAAAVAAGVQAHPDVAASAVIDRLSASFGPVVQKILDLIKSGASNLPAILQALTAAGVQLPSWVSLIANILLVVAKPAA